MITRIRKIADSLIVKIILVLVAASFLGIGASSFMQGNNGGDLVIFSKSNEISMLEFQKAKARQIQEIQNRFQVTLSEEDIIKFGVNKMVLDRLISERMIGYLGQKYEFDLSDERIIEIVKSLPDFHNDQGEFDSSLFKSALRNYKKRQADFVEHFKKDLIKNLFFNIFAQNLPKNQALQEILIRYMAESRIVNILKLDLEKAQSDFKMPEISEEEIVAIYETNKQNFVIPELRSFEYIKFDKNILLKSVAPKLNELKDFYEENIDYFADKKFSDVKTEVKEMYLKEKIFENSSQLAKELEEHISGGMTLYELAKKYNLKIQTSKDLSIKDLSESKNNDYTEMADIIFELGIDETSYPIEIQSDRSLIVLAVNEISVTRQKPMNEVRSDIKDIITKRKIAKSNYEFFKKLREKYTPGGQFNATRLKKNGVSLIGDKKLIRSELSLDKEYPEQLLLGIFSVNKNDKTNILSDGKNLYFSYVKSIYHNNANIEKVKRESGDYFTNAIREQVFVELIDHLTKENDIKLNQIER